MRRRSLKLLVMSRRAPKSVYDFNNIGWTWYFSRTVREVVLDNDLGLCPPALGTHSVTIPPARTLHDGHGGIIGVANVVQSVCVVEVLENSLFSKLVEFLRETRTK